MHGVFPEEQINLTLNDASVRALDEEYPYENKMNRILPF